MSSFSTVQIIFLISILVVGLWAILFRWKQSKSLKKPITVLVVALLVSSISIIFYNGYYKMTLDENELPINDRRAAVIALKSENGGWLDIPNAPYAHHRTTDKGSFFSVILQHEGDGCTKKIIDVEKQTGKILDKRTDTAECHK